jgi:alkaline phosphatase/alkaline phosphatase D
MALLPAVLAVLAACAQHGSIELANGQGEMVGEVTTNSVILQSRLTLGTQRRAGGLPGAEGEARFEISKSSHFTDPAFTDWVTAVPEHDSIIKIKVEDLDSGIRYYYRLIYGPRRDSVATGPTRTFKTLDGAEIASKVSFVVVTGMNYHHFHDHSKRAYQGADKELGYPALKTILALKPDFFVGTGDNVYYDVPYRGRARTAEKMRKKWHEQFEQPRYVDLFAEIPTYWEKDDHDYRYNDCDNTTDMEPSPTLGAAIFREQVPIVDPEEPHAVTYRTYRINRDLQIWLVEGRDYRSPNMMPSGPEKSLWGVDQRRWLQKTLLESDATFRILISPGPMIGPDDAKQAGPVAEGHDRVKRDNHADPGGFQHERDEFFHWLKENNLHQNFYIVCGDRHWQYHSIHPTGFEEFSCGALVDANSRLGRPPGDPDSTDPEALIEQPYTYDEPTGGFLRVTVKPEPEPSALFSFFDENGTLLYEVEKLADFNQQSQST